jgi:8-oxo-dGTP pyrophosphatase MutT (NUDIX family)
MQASGHFMGKKSRLRKIAARLGKLDQVAALPYRAGKEGLEILVVTSRRTKRFIIPKGWPIPGLLDARAAAIEANEEAGVKGTVSHRPMGSFEYIKEIGSRGILIRAEVFPLEVRKVKSSWKEQKQRKRKWLPLDQAIIELDDAGLKKLIDQNRAAIGSPI